MGSNVKVLQNYINGQWIASDTPEVIDVTNPATNEVIARVPKTPRHEVEMAVEAARDAFLDWRLVPLSRRLASMRKLTRFLTLPSTQEELARIITREHGKLLSEASGEMGRAYENLWQVCVPNLMAGRYLPNIATGGLDRFSRLTPRGVFSIINPFNFPVMIGFWSFVYAVFSGNTVVIKPSEQTPMTMARIFEIIHDYADFPPGVVNLVHGDADAADVLVTHEDISGVCSVSSTRVMKAIAEKAGSLGKPHIGGGGAKNFVVITQDVDLDIVVPHVLESVFGNTGQRCLAGSNVVLVGSQQFYYTALRKLVTASRRIRVGAGNRPNVDMGPVISRESKERIISYIEQGIEAGAKLELDGRTVDPDGDPHGYWLGPTIFSAVEREMGIARDEIFGPVMAVMHVQSLDEVIQMIQDSPFGNAAAVFTRDRRVEARFEADDIEVGNLGFDIGTPAPDPPFPFGGMGDSFSGVINLQGEDMLQFFTRPKIITRTSR